MKSSYWLIASLQIAFVIILIALTSLLFFPLQRQLDETIQGLKTSILETLEDYLGSDISFTSIHPSIFNFIEIRDLKIHDRAGETILTVDRVILYYRIGALLRGNALAAPRLVEVRGGSVFPNRLTFADAASGESQLEISNIPDNLTVLIRNYSVHIDDAESDMDFYSLISRGRVLLKEQSLEFDLVNVSRFEAPSPQIESGVFEFAGTSLLEGQLTLPAVLNLSEIRKKSFLQVSISARDMDSNIFDLQPVDLYADYVDEVFTLQSLEGTQAFAFELLYNTAYPLQFAGSNAVSVQAAVPSLTIGFVSSEWTPSSILRFRNEYQPYNYLLESIINADIDIELTDVLMPFRSKLYIDAETQVPVLDQTVNTYIALDQADDIFILDAARILTQGGDGISVQGAGNIREQTFNLSGSIRNKGISVIPTLATEFTVDYDRGLADLRFQNSSFQGVSIGEIQVSSEFTPDSISVVLEGGLESGKGQITASARIFNLSDDPVITAALDIEDVPVVEVAEAIAIATGISGLSLPDELKDSTIHGNVNSQIPLNADLRTELLLDVTRFHVITPTTSMPQLSLTASYEEGILQIPLVDIHYGNQIAQIFSTGDLRDPRRYALNFDITVNSISYLSDLVIIPERKELSLRGSYQSSADFRQIGNRIQGSLSLGNFPTPFFGENAWLSGLVTTDISTDNILESSVDIRNLGLHRAVLFPGAGESECIIEASGVFGTGIAITDLVYSDTVSLLSGRGGISLNSDREEIALEAELFNSLENYTLQAIVSLSDVSLVSTISLENFTVRRLGIPDITGLLNTRIDITQNTTDGLALSFDLNTVNARLQDEPLSVQMSGLFEDEVLSLTGGGLELSTIGLRNISARYNTQDGSLEATTDIFLADINRNKQLSQRVDISVGLPNLITGFEETENTTLSRYWKNTDGTVIFTSVDETGEAVEEWKFDLFEESDNLRIDGGPSYALHTVEGLLNPGGQFTLALDPVLPVTFSAEGFIENATIDVVLTNVRIDPETIEIPTNIITFRNGKIEGSARIAGSIVDPDFYGTFFFEDLRGNLTMIPAPLLAPRGVLILEAQSMYFPPTFVQAGEGGATLQGELIFDHWIPTGIALNVSTGESGVPIIHDFNSVAVDGWARGNIDLSVDFFTGGFDLAGEVTAEATGITISDRARREQAASQTTTFPINVDLSITAGRGVEFYWPDRDLPILRSFAVNGEQIMLNYSSIPRQYTLSGDVALRGGEIFYFEQDFNIRQGNILFNENRDKKFDPLVNLSAEFRSVNRGDPIRIYLEIVDDTISQMQPRFSSDPARPEAELVVLLGGKATGTEDGNTIDINAAIASGSQILGQIRALTDIETEIRETLDLDLLSIRVGVLQNLLENAITVSSAPDPLTTAPVSLGEYLSNTTLVIGKYLGDDIFLEGSVQLQERDPFDRPVEDQLGLTVSPEVRIEWNTPIFTITWAWAILKNPDTLSVTDHRITFSRSFFLDDD